MIIKPVSFAPGYFVSEHGDLFSTLLGSMKRLKRKIDHHGYYRYRIKIGDKRKDKCVHSLVISAFVGPRPEGKECAHVDGDKLNNHYTNLKWVTHKENESHKQVHGTKVYGEKITNSKLLESDISVILGLLSNGVPCSKIALHYGVSRVTIQFIKTRKNWSHVSDVVDGALLKGQTIALTTNICPDCGRSFKRPADLGLHRKLERVGRGACSSIDLENIKRLLVQGVSQNKIADKYKVNQSTIRKISRDCMQPTPVMSSKPGSGGKAWIAATCWMFGNAH